MRAQGSLLRARQPAVELLRERELGLAARQRPLELLAQGAARAEDQGLDGADRDAQDLRDLRVRASLELAHHERCALVERKLAQRAADVLGARPLVLGNEGGNAVVELDLGRPARGLAEA